MSVQHVLLIRHGETDFNREHRLQGVMAVPLNDNGIAQAASVAKYLSRLSIDRLYSSPILRAYETAEIISRAILLPCSFDKRLREIEFGIFEGLTFPLVEKRFPVEHKKWTSGYLDYGVPKGESRRDVQQRMRAAWNDITENEDSQTVALVTHGSAISIFLGSIYAPLPDKPVKNSSITTLTRSADIWEIAGFAETPHFE